MNPYHDLLLTMADTVAGVEPADLWAADRDQFAVHFNARSEWIHPETANHLLVLAYAWSQGRTELLPNCERYCRHLIEAAVDDRWYHKEPGMGDDNVNRFCLVPLLESFRLLREALPADLVATMGERLTAILAVQRREYGEGRFGIHHDLYPNMDVYYCLIMLHGWQLFGDAACRAEYERFIRRLEAAQLADGAWTYIRDTNECPPYHHLNVCALARVAALAPESSAAAQIARSVPYYPRATTPTGVIENHTDCWWKHTWHPAAPMAADTVASLTGDGANRAVGDLLRPAGLARVRDDFTPAKIGVGNNYTIWIYAAACAWRDVPAAPGPSEWLVHDGNIDGPRGRYAGWSWAATAAYGGDTLVGAVAHVPEGIRALTGVVAEVPWWREDLGPLPGNGIMNLMMVPPGVVAHTETNERGAIFEVAYRLMCCRGVFNGETFPCDWECRQRWQLGATTMRGEIRWRSRRAQRSRPPTLRVRFGLDGDLVANADGTYAYGPFTVRLLRNDLPEAVIEPVPAAYYLLEKHCRHLRLSTDLAAAETDFGAGDTLAVDLEISLEDPR